MSIAEGTTERLRTAAAELERKGWARGYLGKQDDHGRVSLLHALDLAGPMDACRHLGELGLMAALGVNNLRLWHDESPDLTQEQVVSLLRTTTVEDVHLTWLFGPQWRQVVEMLDRVVKLGSAEASALSAAWREGGGPESDSWSAIWAAEIAYEDPTSKLIRHVSVNPLSVASMARLGAVRLAVQNSTLSPHYASPRESNLKPLGPAGAVLSSAAYARMRGLIEADAGLKSARSDVVGVVRAAGDALIVRHVVGVLGPKRSIFARRREVFSRAHYELMISPWASVMGKVHPGD